MITNSLKRNWVCYVETCEHESVLNTYEMLCTLNQVNAIRHAFKNKIDCRLYFGDYMLRLRNIEHVEFFNIDYYGYISLREYREQMTTFMKKG